ncbi:hypothetical protein BK011_06525 [Tenericutes bacterium MZ-XQ]|jgi:hypothetical protein|nr:hypothetical protein BK011_06525 [Tenericutes bacterium MZ-XQ]
MSLEALRKYIDQLDKDHQNSHTYRAISSFDMIENIDLMIKRYLDQPQEEKGAVLLDVFGLLQGLFVAIDALYDLAIGLTQYKYHININSNPILHELKYIRNDIVGHPTHRTYHQGGMGFSILIADKMSKEKIVYQTFIYQKNNIEVKEKEVVFKPLLDHFTKEKQQILTEIYQYLVHEETTTDIPEKLFTLYETLNEDLLAEIVEDFRKTYELDESSKHRFFWRADLLKTLINWHEQDDDFNELIYYMSKTQVSKMYEMALDMEHRKGQDLYTEIPSILYRFYKFMRRYEKDGLKLLSYVHDKSHPLHQGDVLALMTMNPPKDVYKLLMFLKQQTSEEKVFLIGSAMRAYRPKNR